MSDNEDIFRRIFEKIAEKPIATIGSLAPWFLELSYDFTVATTIPDDEIQRERFFDCVPGICRECYRVGVHARWCMMRVAKHSLPASDGPIPNPFPDP